MTNSCCVFPAFQIDPEAPVAFDPSREQLVRPERFQNVQVSFRIVTTGFRDHVQLAVTPQEGTVSAWEVNGLLQPWSRRAPVEDDRRGVPSPLDGLRATAAKVLRERGIETRYVDVRFESQGAVFAAEGLTDSEWLAYLNEETKASGRVAAAAGRRATPGSRATWC